MTRILPTVCDARALRRLTDRPLLGSVSLVDSNGSLRSERLYNLLFGLAFAVLIALYGAWGLKVFLKSVALA